MNDLKDVFELALADDAGAPSSGSMTSDPGADLARGRKLLARRTHRRMLGGALVTAAVVAAATFAVLPSGASGGPGVGHVAAGPASRAKAAQKPAQKPAHKPTVSLVAYTGAQPPGYTVTVIPAGWVIQGSNPFILVIAPANDPDKNPDSFIGKLMVGQGTFDPSGSDAQGWAPVHVPGHTVYYSVQNAAGTETAGLVIEKKPGDWLNIQAPTSLGWTKQQLVRFGLGVTILAAAQESKG